MTHSNPPKPLDLAALRQKKGKEFWRTLDELAETEEFAETIRQEFPRQAGLLGSLNRRDFLKVLGASMALAGLSGCMPAPAGKIMPYSKPPEELVPGKPLFYASAMPWDGYVEGVVVKSEMGRPVKVDGNPRHPISQGASNIFMQASLLDLYDPDRAKEVTNGGQPAAWADFTAALAQAAPSGAALRILTGLETSPTLIAQLDDLLTRFPNARWVRYSATRLGAQEAGAAAFFGQPAHTVYHLEPARVILALDADFLFGMPGSLRYAREFSAHREPDGGEMNRLYVVESSYSITGANADHRLPLPPSQVEPFARALAARLGVEAGAAPSGAAPWQAWLDAAAADLQAAGASALVIAGERQPAAVHALALAINQALGAINTTVTLTPAIAPELGDPIASLRQLVEELNGGAVDALLILGENPAYTAPADLGLANAIGQARFSAYLGAHADETAALCQWHVPAAHYLEMWSDGRAADGTASVIQPLIEPLYGGKSPHELLAVLQGQPDASGYDLVRAYWQGASAGTTFETTWAQALQDGYVRQSAPPPAGSTAAAGAVPAPSAQPAGGGGLEIVFEPDHTIWDGRFANNAWLQELPKQLTKLTWDNAALVGPALAQAQGLADGDIVTLALRGASVDAGILILPGLPENTVVATLGYGRSAGGKVLEGAGYNAYALRTSEAPWWGTGLQLTKTGGRINFATTRDHQSMENRHLVRLADLAEYLEHPDFAQEHAEGEDLSLYGDEWQYPGRAWGMAINLNTCIGCNACVLACQSENNIPTVGKSEVQNAREMHWLRVDRYFVGGVDQPSVAFQPVPCMHCEKAPCEPVCPVEATSHSAEGLNEMTYNRCVGTRYCSNNCPYKVRRFNFFNYVDGEVQSLRAMRNPNVSVRSRGVMEKCTYCVQRINLARQQAEAEGRPIADGEVRTACQQACPVNAIVFGDINDAESQVRKLKETPRNYALLGELGTRPRTTYLARIKNPNPQLAGEGEG